MGRHYAPQTNLVSGPYHKLSTKWAQFFKKMGCNMFFNAKWVALTDDANLKNFWLIGFSLDHTLSHGQALCTTIKPCLGPIPQTEHKMGAIYQKDGL